MKGQSSAFTWLALSTSDVEGASAFYTRLFDWNVIPAPVDAFLVAKSGVPVGSLIDHRKNEFARKEPANWLPFARVDDIDAAASRVSEFGGRLWVPPHAVGDARVAVVRGATGEAFGMWHTPEGSPLVNDRESCAWFELATREPERAAAFYRGLFGWKIADEGGYTFISNESEQFGGIVKLAGDWEDWAFMAAIGRVKGEKLEVPPHWMVFFAVEDCDSFVEEAEVLGAQVMTHPEPLHTVGTMSIMRDPQGVYFSVLSKR